MSNITSMKRSNSKNNVKKLTKQSKRLTATIESCLRPNPIYYPHPITPTGANQFNNGTRQRPLKELEDSLKKRTPFTQLKNKPKHVIHWFRSDLRTTDNTGLSNAIRFFESLNDKPDDHFKLQTIYVINENDWYAHLESKRKIAVMYQAVRELKIILDKLCIPLTLLIYPSTSKTLSSSSKFTEWFIEKLNEITNNEAFLLTANIQYEFDELTRDNKILETLPTVSCFQLYHDSCIVEPGILFSQSNRVYQKFTPWYKRWCEYLDKKSNDTEVFHTSTVKNKRYNKEFIPTKWDYKISAEFQVDSDIEPNVSKKNVDKLVHIFLSNNVNRYTSDKDYLTSDCTSHVGVYLTLGIISPRTLLNRCFKCNGCNILMNMKNPKRNPVEEYIRQLAWRDFYKHALCEWPYMSMDLPFNLSTTELKWETDVHNFKRWCNGETGFPIIDAIMRQLYQTGFICNRARMITASFLSKNLFINWQWGERWFRLHLIDYDLISNVGGWGYCSSTGIDCQPYFRVFNIETQSEKYDPDGKYIKKWVPELKNIANVHDGESYYDEYSPRIVDLKETRERFISAFRDLM